MTTGVRAQPLHTEGKNSINSVILYVLGESSGELMQGMSQALVMCS